MCRDCERIKPFERHCECKPHQQAAIVEMERKLGRPMYDPNAHPSETTVVEVMSTAFDSDGNAKLIEDLEAPKCLEL